MEAKIFPSLEVYKQGQDNIFSELLMIQEPDCRNYRLQNDGAE